MAGRVVRRRAQPLDGFGYFETQEEDERVLAEVARVLVPGGVFVLDTVNQAALLRGFRPQAWDELDDGVVLLQEHAYDLITGRSQATWTFLRDGERKELSFEHRLYTTPEYVELLRRAGSRRRRSSVGPTARS